MNTPQLLPHHDCLVELAIPKSPTQIKSFIISLIELAEFRTKADNLSIS